MAYFAEIGLDNIVLRVVVINDNNAEQEELGASFCRDLFGGTWLQTVKDGSFRKNFATVGSTYDSNKNAFIPPKTFNSWVLDESTCKWVPPFAYPDDDNQYIWNEDTQTWDIIT